MKPTSTPIYETADIRRIEQAAGTPQPTLMERAGLAAAELAVQLVSARGKDILVLAGPGNNGGDAFEAAVHLLQGFFRVSVVSLADPAKLPADAARAHAKWRAAGGQVLGEVPAGKRWDLVIDGLFGIGLARAPSGEYARLIDCANAQPCPVLALDIPSGLASDTGSVLGGAVRASHTLTFIAHKPGLLTLDGPDYCGALHIAALGLDARALVPPKGCIAAPGLFAAALAPRPNNFHKGDAGSIAIIGGAAGMCGAALLAGRAALKLGAGRVYVGLLEHAAPGLDPLALELMLRHPDEVLGLDLDALVVGPGLGEGERAETLLAAGIASDIPLVMDADALNLVARSRNLQQACARRSAETIITPHPAEAARLLGTETRAVQEDRLAAARRLRALLGAHVVLKGNGSVLVLREGRWFINTTGNSGMASAGMGDVLAGILGALLGQRFPGEAAMVLGTHLHGLAADELAAAGSGPIGLTAGEIADAARRIYNRWREKPRQAKSL